MSYGKVLSKLHEGNETITLQENGRFYEFQSTVSAGFTLLKESTSPERLQDLWEIFWWVMMESIDKMKYIREV